MGARLRLLATHDGDGPARGRPRGRFFPAARAALGWLLRKRCFVFSRPLVAVAAGDGMLKDGQHKLLAADAKA